MCPAGKEKTKAFAAFNPDGFAAFVALSGETKRAHLPEEDVAVCAEMQRVAVLLPVRIATAQLEVHLLPLQVTLVAHQQTLPDLKVGARTKKLLSGGLFFATS